MSGLYALENDEAFESDESYDDAYDEAYDEAYDDAFGGDEAFDEARRRRRRPRRIRPGRTASGKGLFPRRASSNRFVTQAQFAASVKETSKQIRDNGMAIKRVSAQASKVTTDLAAATSRLDKQVGEVKKEVKKQSEMTLLLTLLQKAPELEARTGADPVQAGNVLNSVQVKKQSNLLPLVLLSGSGGLGGGDSSNLLILALALGGQL